MALYKTRAIAIKSINLSESDRLVTFMTENHGKVKCVAKGARKIKNPVLGCLGTYVPDPFNLFWQGAPEPFPAKSLRHHRVLFKQSAMTLTNSIQASIFSDLIDSMILEGHREVKVFNLLYQSLAALNQQSELEPLASAF